MFKLHAQLEKDLIYIGKLDLSLVFIHPNSENQWIILVPEVADIKELHSLADKDQAVLLSEINTCSRFMEQEYRPDKINIGALGNMVPQLHVHIIARYKDDIAWPGAIWGHELSSDKAKIEEFSTRVGVLLSTK